MFCSGKMPQDKHLLSKKGYYASINFVDEGVGEVVKTLKDKNLLENTFILFTSGLNVQKISLTKLLHFQIMEMVKEIIICGEKLTCCFYFQTNYPKSLNFFPTFCLNFHCFWNAYELSSHVPMIVRWPDSGRFKKVEVRRDPLNNLLEIFK